jgi:thiamine biosynthesis lipoprotein
VGLHRFTFRAMAAENEVQVHSGSAGHARQAADAAIAEVALIEAKYSRYRADSIVSRINASAGEAPVPVDGETRALLAYADACYRQSGGLFDATSGVLRRAWRFDTGRVPSDEDLARLLPLIGWDQVELTGTTVRLARAGMQLDFGGFGKEYAVDRAAQVLVDAGVESGMVNLAGDATILAPQPGGAPWQVGIRHPRRDDALVATLPISSGAIATSGDYERFIEAGGIRHCHMLDPRTGHSVHGLQSVSVHAASCLVAGSATTIAMLKGDAGVEWLREIGVPFLCVRGDGRVVNAFEPSAA